MARKFIYEGKEYDDPDPNMTPDEVRQSFTEYFAELANAEIKETKRGEDTVYTFAKRVGVKGAKIKVEVEIPDGEFCMTCVPFEHCPFYWQSEDGEEGCLILGEQKEMKEGGDTSECKKFLCCPNPPPVKKVGVKS